MPIDLDDILEFLESEPFGTFIAGLGGGLILTETISRPHGDLPSQDIVEEFKKKSELLDKLQREAEQIKKEYEKEKIEKKAYEEKIKALKETLQQKNLHINELQEHLKILEKEKTNESKEAELKYTAEKNTLETALAKITKEYEDQITQIKELEKKLNALEEKRVQKEQRLQQETEKIIYKTPKTRPTSKNTQFDFEVLYQPGKDILHGEFDKIPHSRGIIFRAVFRAIEKELKEGNFPDLSHFTMDVPMQLGKENDNLQLVRIFRYVGDEQMRCQVLDKYQNEPMFPRLFMTGSPSAIELPKSIRIQACKNYYPYTRGKNPFTERQIEILQKILKEPNLTNKEIAERLNRDRETIESHYKNIQKIAMEIFMLQFHPRKLIAHYWHETGFILI